MDEKRLFKSVAEAVMLTANDVVPDWYSVDVSLDDQSLKQLRDFVATVSYFVSVFYDCFERIFSEHCKVDMSSDKFVKFVDPRIELLSPLKGYFGYILPCAFVRQVLHLFSKEFHNRKFLNEAQNCLEKFLERKFHEEEREIVSTWHELLDYCKNINKKLRPFDSSSESETSSDDCASETASVPENSELNLRTPEDGHANDSPIPNITEGKDKVDSVDAYKKTATEENTRIGDVSKTTNISVESQNRKTKLSSQEIHDEVCNILMPEGEFREEVFILIQKCEGSLDGPANEVVNLEV